MADIAPFRGILYDAAKVSLAKVVAPPHDDVDAAARARLGALDPKNVVRLEAPEPNEAGYTGAARTLDAWLGDGTLVRDPYKSIYRYVQHFTSADAGARPLVRRGVIAAVRLADEGRMLPHLRTTKRIADDRAALARASWAQTSPATALFADALGEVERLLKPTEGKRPAIDVTADGVRHVLWRVTDAELMGKLKRAFAPKKLVIADGHHRCEGLLALRASLATRAGAHGLSAHSSAHYGMMFLVCQADEGLVVLPSHRLIHGVAGFDKQALLARAAEFFIVEKIANAGKDPAAVRAALADPPGHQPAILVAFPGEPDGWRLLLDAHVDPASFGMTGDPLVMRLDASVLHGLVLDRILGLTPTALEKQDTVRKVGDVAAGLAQLAGAQAAFFLGPPKLETVRYVAEIGDPLPPHADIFTPRPLAGLVMNRVDPDEDLA